MKKNAEEIGEQFEKIFETDRIYKYLCRSWVELATQLIKCLVTISAMFISLKLLERIKTEIDVYAWLISIPIGLVAYFLTSFYLKRAKWPNKLFYLIKKIIKHKFIKAQMKMKEFV